MNRNRTGEKIVVKCKYKLIVSISKYNIIERNAQ